MPTISEIQAKGLAQSMAKKETTQKLAEQAIDMAQLHQQMNSAFIKTATTEKVKKKAVPDWNVEVGFDPVPSPFGGTAAGGKAPKNKHAALDLVMVGADVEEFLCKPGTKEPVPVIGLIGGTKEKPLPVLEHLQPGFALQEDNVALEYNVPPAATSLEFTHNLLRIREEISKRVGQLGLESAIKASMLFTPEQLEHPQARRFGCEPDFDVWARKVNESPAASDAAQTLRTAGGHVHVSFLVNGEPVNENDHLLEMELVVMGLDLWLGVPMAFLDTDVDRRKLYGRTGAFRPKPYGIEYRVLSNFWTTTPQLIHYTFEQVRHTLRMLNDQKWARSDFEGMKTTIANAINNRHLESIAHLSKMYHIAYPTAGDFHNVMNYL